MEIKGLAKEYLIKAKENAIYFKDGEFSNMPLYQESSITIAFYAGFLAGCADKALKSLPELEFKQDSKGGFVAENTIFLESYCLCLKAITGEWSFYLGLETPVKWYATRKKAEQAANKAYKERVEEMFKQLIKQRRWVQLKIQRNSTLKKD